MLLRWNGPSADMGWGYALTILVEVLLIFAPVVLLLWVARALLCGMRRAERAAPSLSAQATAWILCALGAGWLVLLAFMAPSEQYALTHSVDNLAEFARWQYIACVGGGLASVIVGAVLLRSRGSWRNRRGVSALVALLTAIDILELLIGNSANAGSGIGIGSLKANMPSYALLSAERLVYHAAPGEPTSPVRLEYLAAGPARTYVSYTVVSSLRSGTDWYPRLFDARGHAYPTLALSYTCVHCGLFGLLPGSGTVETLAIYPALARGMAGVTITFEQFQGAGREAVHVLLGAE